MLRNRSIAFFIDVDNVDLTSENFDSIVAQLEGMGQIYSGKVYGAKERKHKAIYDQAEVKGYKVERPMRMKRRGRKDFDSRIFVDVVDAVCRASSIDAVCVITASCDLVYLYSYLHGKGIKVISSDENEQASSALVDEYVDLGRIYEVELPKPVVKPVKRTATRPAVATATRSVARAIAKNTEAAQESKQPVSDDKTVELLKEIERLKRVAEETQAEKEAKSKAAEEARKKAEEEARARAEEREKAKREIEEAKAKAREEAEAKAREDERQKAQKAIEEARAKAREEAEAKAREEERQRAQKEIEEAKKRAEAAAEKAKAEEEARAKAEAEIRLKLAELAKTGGNNDELMRELEKLKSLTSETNQLVKEMKDEPKEQANARSADEEARIREEERLRTQRVIEEAKAKARAEAEQKVREQSESKAEAERRAREEERLKAEQVREEERQKARQAIEEAKAKAREEAEAKAREEERQKAQAEIEQIRKKAQEAADKAKAEEEERQKAQAEIEHWKSLAEQQAEQQNEENDSPSAKYYMQRTDGKLLKKIEEINKGGNSDTDDELLATIKDLLDGLDD